MKKNKTPFFIKAKNAITKFDEYENFSEEKIWQSIKYLIKLTLLFTFIISIALTYKIVTEGNKVISDFKDECPEFSFKNYTLEIEGDSKKIVKGDEEGYFGFIVDAEKENLSDVEETGDYERVIIFLKNRLVIRNSDGIETSTTYEDLSKNYNLDNINKNTVIQFLSRK